MKRVWPMLAVLALAAIAGSAQAQSSVGVQLFGPGVGKVLSETNISFRTQGEMVVSFRGDAAAGCAAYGLCPYSGTVVVRPQDGALAIITVRENGRIRHAVSLLLGLGDGLGAGGYTTSARVQRSAPNGPGGTCADAQGSSFLGAGTLALTRGRSITIRLLMPGGSLLQTRCAGPLDGDLTAVSPAVTLPLSRLSRGRMVLHLSGTRTFAVHGFAGTITSTLILHLGRPQTSSASSSSAPPGVKTRRSRIVTEQLHLVRSAGALGATIRGTSDPIVCGLLDTCGLSGTVTLGPVGKAASAQLLAEGPATRPQRDFLTALGAARGGNPRGIKVAVLVNLQGEVHAEMTQAGASCTDTALSGGIAVAAGTLPGPSPGFAAFAGSWRTRCPGPSLESLSPGLTTALPSGALTHRLVTVGLRASGSLDDDGYVISPQGRLSIVLGRGRIRQQVVAQPAG